MKFSLLTYNKIYKWNTNNIYIINDLQSENDMIERENYI